MNYCFNNILILHKTNFGTLKLQGDSGGPLMMKASDGRWFQVNGIDVEKNLVHSDRHHCVQWSRQRYRCKERWRNYAT